MPLHLIDEAAARAAGFDDLDTLKAMLTSRSGGEIYRVALRRVGPDPRIALRGEIPTASELNAILVRLARWDQAAPKGSWTEAVLGLIGSQPGVRAGDLAVQIGVEKAAFKVKVRKLKGLGLTESLKVGYRLSPRGKAVLDGSPGPSAIGQDQDRG